VLSTVVAWKLMRTVEADTAPTGMIARGHYNAVSKFVDDDSNTLLQFNWSFDITKDWK
jgi:Rho GDP-dissociation inhibitor